MQKPISSSLIYRKQSTTAQVPTAYSVPTDQAKATISSTVQTIFDLIVLDN